MSRQRIAVGLFFLSLLIVGIVIFKDYGINWDEPVHEWRGQAFLDYVLHGDRRLINHEHERNYGTFPDIILAAVERAVEQDSRTVYLTRHLMLFLIFCLGVWFFYLLGRKIFARWEIALLGCLMLVLSPRIFAHSFYNPKDTPLMTAVIVAFYTLVRFLEKPGPARLAWHALACAVATDVRLNGMLTFFLTGAAFLFLLWEDRKNRKKLLSLLALGAVFTVLYLVLTILLWPYLWEDPAGRIASVFQFATHVPWQGHQLYLREYYTCGETPWHYIPVWIAISTPLLYLGLCFIGVFALIGDAFRNRKRSSQVLDKTQGPLALLWFFVPPLGSILLGVCTFNEFRHLFFIYPALLLIGLSGFLAISGAANKIRKRKYSTAAKIILAAVMLAGMGRVAFFMVRNHPHENVYFNRLAGRDMASVAKKFEMDYWGLSYKQGLEYLLRIDPSDVIKVAVDFRPGEFNVWIQPRDERRRLFTFKPLWIYLDIDRRILRFAERNPSKYFVNRRFKYLVVRSRMTVEERDELLQICRHPHEKEAIEQVYLESQKLEPSRYFMTNYSLYPGEFPLEKIHSINVGNASILGIYLLPQGDQP
ncbi:MAG: glycosyltransferase family 39 protein [Clostridiales bacterium]|nr:glycosyltransferase family 39 protein [Clostridiales bacterium]